MRLSTAGVAIGWIGSVLSLLCLIFISIALADVDALVKKLVEINPDIDAETVRHVAIGLLVLYLVIIMINLLTSVLLVVGTVKERHLLLVPWLLNSGVSLLFNCIAYVFAIFAMISNSTPFSNLAAGIIVWGLSVSFQYYIWYTIMSLFKKIRIDREQQQHLLTASNAAPSYSKL